MAKRFIKLDQKKKSLIIDGLLLEQPLVFEFFNAQPETEREQLLIKALMLGVLALKEDRLAAFLAKTSNTLGTELEQLKYIFDLQKELFFRTTAKGRDAEHDLVAQLKDYARTKNFSDLIEHCGETFGALPKNKTGDILIKVNGQSEACLAIESKFDKAKRLGSFLDKDIFAKGDTAFSQLLEAKCNRNALESIIVFDESAIDPKLKQQIGSAQYFQQIGFICIIDHQRNYFEPLFMCYDLARAILTGTITKPTEHGQLALIIARFLHDINLLLDLKKRCRALLKECQEMIDIVDKGTTSLEFTKEIFNQFCQQGYLSNEEILQFYTAEIAKERYASLRETT